MVRLIMHFEKKKKADVADSDWYSYIGLDKLEQASLEVLYRGIKYYINNNINSIVTTKLVDKSYELHREKCQFHAQGEHKRRKAKCGVNIRTIRRMLNTLWGCRLVRVIQRGKPRINFFSKKLREMLKDFE